LILSLLSTEYEELPGWNSWDKEGALVPSVNLVHAIRVVPFFLLKIELHDIVELHLGVPSTIDEDLSVTGESGVTSSAFWWTVGWDDFLPSLGLQVETVEIVEGGSGVTESSMSSKEINLAFVTDSGGVGSWGRSSNARLEVLSVVLIVADSSPSLSGLHLEEPGIVKSGLRVVMSSKEEHSVDLLSILDGDGNMLCSGKRLVSRWGSVLIPSAIVGSKFQGPKITGRFDFTTLGVFDTSKKEIILTTNPRESMSGPCRRLFISPLFD